MLTRLILPLLLLVCCTGCGTTFSKQYYLFSGQVVDAESGAPVPRASVYIAAEPDDLFAPPHDYSQLDEPNRSVAFRIFERQGANRYLFFKTDDEGRFQTVWRRDAMSYRPFPLMFFPDRLNEVAFCVGSKGYITERPAFKRSLFQRGYAWSPDAIALQPNELGTLTVRKGSGPGLDPKPAPIADRYLQTRFPLQGVLAEDEFKWAEQAFGRKDYAQALKGYDAALARELNPAHPLLMFKRLDMLYLLGRYEETLQYGNEYLAHFPHVGFVHKIIADAAFKLGRQDLNRAHLIRASQLDPEFEASLRNLAQLDPRFGLMPEGWPWFYELWR